MTKPKIHLSVVREIIKHDTICELQVSDDGEILTISGPYDPEFGQSTTIQLKRREIANLISALQRVEKDMGPKMMPGSDLYTPDELDKLERLKADAIAGDPGEGGE